MQQLHPTYAHAGPKTININAYACYVLYYVEHIYMRRILATHAWQQTGGSRRVLQRNNSDLVGLAAQSKPDFAIKTLCL